MPILTCAHTLYQKKTYEKRLVSKILYLTCVPTLYNNNKITKRDCCKNSQPYMCTYPLQQHKQNHKGSVTKFQVLNFYTPSKTI